MGQPRAAPVGGMTGEPMADADADVTALIEMVLPQFADGAGPA